MTTTPPVIRRGKGFWHVEQNTEDPVRDVSTWTFRAYLRDGPSGRFLVAFTVDDTDAVSGRVVLSLTSAQTSALPPDVTEAAYDVEIEIPDVDEPQTLFEAHRVPVKWQATRTGQGAP